MDWNLYRCGRAGHITYAPDEPAIREHLHARTATDELWRCVRCGTFVIGPPDGSGAVAQAPVVRRGKEIRSEIILRLFAIERFLRFLLFGALAYGVFRFGQSHQTIEQAFKRDIPIFRSLFHQLGWNIDHSSILGLFRKALRLTPNTLHLLAVGLAVFAVVEGIEGVGLWLAKRWGEYFAAAVTALGLPYEIYDLTTKITATRIILFILNLALVLYLILTKRLFGARGGKRAYEARLRSESIFDEAATAAAATGQSAVPAAGTQATAATVGAPFAQGATAAPAGPAPPSEVPSSSAGPPTPAGYQAMPAPAARVGPSDATTPMAPSDPDHG
jgi:uncharacterized membrane protein (DUF2068 family)